MFQPHFISKQTIIQYNKNYSKPNKKEKYSFMEIMEKFVTECQSKRSKLYFKVDLDQIQMLHDIDGSYIPSGKSAEEESKRISDDEDDQSIKMQRKISSDLKDNVSLTSPLNKQS